MNQVSCWMLCFSILCLGLCSEAQTLALEQGCNCSPGIAQFSPTRKPCPEFIEILDDHCIGLDKSEVRLETLTLSCIWSPSAQRPHRPSASPSPLLLLLVYKQRPHSPSAQPLLITFAPSTPLPPNTRVYVSSQWEIVPTTPFSIQYTSNLILR